MISQPGWVFGFDPEQIWVTVFEGDEELGLGPDTEAIEIWKAQGVPEERIVLLPRSENFWQAGATGPCGPCSEMYLDRGVEFGGPDDRPGDDTDRFLEYWNHVFMTYELGADGSLTDLPQRNIDTGLGLERMAAIKQGVASVFETDGFRPLIDLAEELSGHSYDEGGKVTRAMRIIADHSRGAVELLDADDGWREQTAKSDEVFDIADVDDGDLAVLLYTSGTTSLPKGVMLTHGGMSEYVMGRADPADGADHGRLLLSAPLYHIAGVTSMLSALYSGRTVVIMSQFDADRWLEMVERHRITHTFLVPTMLAQLVERPDIASRDLSSVDVPSALTYSSLRRGTIGSKRTRTRAGSNVTMLPFSKASTSWGRFASSVRASASGLRLPAPRNWMTDGYREERTASSVPKSASADTTIRCSVAARSKITSSSACCNPNSRTWIAS